jgi:hypothetical protein
MNILYYGANDSINNDVINLHNINNLKFQDKIYKNTKYIYNNNFLLFDIINADILSFIKNTISTIPINNIKRKIIILNIEQMDLITKTAFRNILEKYYSTTSFIATTSKFSFIDKPIISRFSIIRLSIDKNKLYNETIVLNIKIKPTIIEIKHLVKKSKIFKLKDIINDLIKITPYKQKFTKIASEIEYQYNNHKNIDLALETLFLVCFYPSNK